MRRRKLSLEVQCHESEDFLVTLFLKPLLFLEGLVEFLVHPPLESDFSDAQRSTLSQYLDSAIDPVGGCVNQTLQWRACAREGGFLIATRGPTRESWAFHNSPFPPCGWAPGSWG